MAYSVTIQKQIYNTSDKKDFIVLQIFKVFLSLSLIVLFGFLGIKAYKKEISPEIFLIPFALFTCIMFLNILVLPYQIYIL